MISSSWGYGPEGETALDRQRRILFAVQAAAVVRTSITMLPESW